MSERKDSVWEGMGVRKGRDIDRYYDRDDRDLEEHRKTEAHGEPRVRSAGRVLPWYEPERQRLKSIIRKPELLRGWLEADVSLSGYTLPETLATIKRGRLSAAERPRYDALARGVARLRARGAKLAATGEAIGKGPQTVANLEARGRELLDQAHCSRHSKPEPDCPACLRNAPTSDHGFPLS